MSQTVEAKNKELVLKAFDTLFNKRDYKTAEQFWSSTYIQHSAHIPPGREGLFELIKNVPPTLHYENQLTIANGEYVIKSIASVSHSRNKRSVIALGTNEPCPCVAQTYPIVLANLAGTLAIGLGRSGRKGLCWCVHESQAVGL
jgi:predicted SnoaL-like aldol condensation-catalyzing enzyme